MKVSGATVADTTVAGALREASLSLARAGVDSPRRDARILLAAAIGCRREDLIADPDAPLEKTARDRFDGYISRRSAREPVSRILGRREFWGLEFAITPATLDPRPETETVVEAVLEALPERTAPIEVLDLGTGSGSLLIALLSELPNARGLGVDILPEAVSVARANAGRLGVADRCRFDCGNWGEKIGSSWDVIVANPPYIRDEPIEELPPEVRLYDPPRALYGGPDGLDAYRNVLPHAWRLSRAGGLIALEIGFDQRSDVSALLVLTGFSDVRTARDLQGIERCVLAAKGDSI